MALPRLLWGRPKHRLMRLQKPARQQHPPISTALPVPAACPLQTVTTRAEPSPATVFLLLRGGATVCASETARRIRAAMDEQGYLSAAPRPLPSTTHTLGMCLKPRRIG